MAAGSLAAHSLGYLLTAHTAEGAGETSDRTSTGGAGYLVLFLGILAATLVVAGLGRRRDAAVSPWFFFVLPPLAFALQELSERVLSAEAFPFHAALEPRFLLGLLLQLPFGLLALLVARALMHAVRRLVRALGRSKTPRLRPTVSWSLREAWDLPRIPALALGAPQRGPPAL